MAKFVHDSVLDAALAVIATATVMHINTAQPADRAAAIADSIGNVAVTPGDGNGDFTIANGDVSGRKLTTLAQSIAGVDTSNGTASHISLVNATTLLLVTTCPSQVITGGNAVSVAAFDDEIADPT